MPRTTALEAVIGLLALIVATVGLLLDAYALAVIGLVLAAVGYGILLGSRPAR